MTIPAIWKEPIQGFDPWKDSDDFYFDIKRTNAVINFIKKNLRHSKGEYAGKMFHPEKWEKKIIGHIFGWKNKKTNYRRFRKVFIYIPRKNGKTFICAALGLIGFVADDEMGAEIYCCAADSSQAGLVFSEASSMVEQNPELSNDIRVYRGYKSMKFEATGSYWRVLSSEAGTKHGLNPSFYVVDEVHAQKNSELMEVMETGTGSRRQPLGIYLTTADMAGESACNRMLDYAHKVRDGIVKDMAFFPVVYEADRVNDDWMDEKIWYKANPNLGISIKLEYMKQQCARAKEDPAYENTFKRLHLNMQTEQEMRWMQMHEWDASGQKLKPVELLGKKCFAGMDLSAVSDITAFVLYFPDCSACLAWFWVPKKTAEKRIEYDLWAKEKYIEVEDGRIIDMERIRQRINEIKSQYEIQQIGYDPWNAAQLAKDLADKDGFNMVEFRQGYKSMNEPTKSLMKLVLEHKLVHFGNPVMRWMASNAQSMEDPTGNIKLTKPQKDSQLKVDGIIALVMAFGLSIANKTEDKSVYESKDIDNILKEVYGR